MSKHTPGPWRATLAPSQCEGVNVQFCIDTGGAISIAYGQSQEHLADYREAVLEEQCRANALLIAAAPDLLEVAKLALRMGVYGGVSPSTVEDAARAAIAKATREAK